MAAFDFPSEARPRIDIPPKFWVDIRSGDFEAQLISNTNRGKVGQFLVKPANFIHQYAAWFSDNYIGEETSAERRTSAKVELTSALAGMSTKKDVYILETEWARFVDAGLGQAEHHDEPQKSTRGLHSLRSWDVVLMEVAVELLARQLRGDRLDEPSKIAEVALAKAKKNLAENNPAPLVGTIAKKISEILKRTNELSTDKTVNSVPHQPGKK